MWNYDFFFKQKIQNFFFDCQVKFTVALYPFLTLNNDSLKQYLIGLISRYVFLIFASVSHRVGWLLSINHMFIHETLNMFNIAYRFLVNILYQTFLLFFSQILAEILLLVN